MANILFRAIQQNRKWSKRSNFKNLESALFASHGPRSSAESLWSGHGYAAEQGYGTPYYVAVWEDQSGDQYGNGFLIFKSAFSLSFVPVPVCILEDIDGHADSKCLEELKTWAENVVKSATKIFPLELDVIKKYGFSGKSTLLNFGGLTKEAEKSWTEEELHAAVHAYIDMYRMQRSGTAFIKKKYYSSLSSHFGRSEKAFEYRMQNISFVRSLMGLPWLDGLPPAKNVGAHVASQIEKLINEIEDRYDEPTVEFEVQVQEELKKSLTLPPGNKKPLKRVAGKTQFERDPKVKAWIIEQIGNRCESCNAPAPFVDEKAMPFLELHHLRRLADDGSDTVMNAVLLCPNCHRAFHYSSEKKLLLDDIYVKVGRLIRE